jgi:hypothetical protein
MVSMTEDAWTNMTPILTDLRVHPKCGLSECLEVCMESRCRYVKWLPNTCLTFDVIFHHKKVCTSGKMPSNTPDIALSPLLLVIWVAISYTTA